MPTLYRRLLGEAFETLPGALRDFHDLPGGGAACGALCVTRGKGWLCQALADRMRLPPPGGRVAIRLLVLVEGDRERWVRQFDGNLFETTQWMLAGLLIEAAGPFRFGFRVIAGPEGLRFEQVRGWLYGLPLPRALTPRIMAMATAREASWAIDVGVQLPFVGLLVRYRGEMRPE
jgi:hypothetical protein